MTSLVGPRTPADRTSPVRASAERRSPVRGSTVRALADRGAAATELALLVPIFVLILGAMIAGGRVWLARADVQQAAGAAARAATLARSAAEAQRDARAVAAVSLRDVAAPCPAPAISVDTSAFALPVGTSGTVTVSIRCEIALGDVLVPGLPGSLTASATGSSILDSFRGR